MMSSSDVNGNTKNNNMLCVWRRLAFEKEVVFRDIFCISNIVGIHHYLVEMKRHRLLNTLTNQQEKLSINNHIDVISTIYHLSESIQKQIKTTRY